MEDTKTMTVGQLLDRVRTTMEKAYGDDALTKTIQGATVAITVEDPSPEEDMNAVSASLNMHGRATFAIAASMQNWPLAKRLEFVENLIADLLRMNHAVTKATEYR